MSTDVLIRQARDKGVIVRLVDGKVKLIGEAQAVQETLDTLRPHKADVMLWLQTQPANDPAAVTHEPFTEPPGYEGTGWRLAGADGLSDSTLAKFRAASLALDKSQQLAQEYHQHHFACPVCIAAGQGRGLRCGTGASLWAIYQGHQL